MVEGGGVSDRHPSPDAHNSTADPTGSGRGFDSPLLHQRYKVQGTSMKVAKPRRTYQPTLFAWGLDYTLHSHVAVATVVGSFFEQLAMALVPNAVRLHVDSSCDLCPDFQDPDGEHFYEVKASGDKKFIVWSSQLRQYERLLEEVPVSVDYVFVRYQRKEVLSGRTMRQVLDYLSQHVERVVFCPLQCVRTLVESDWVGVGEGAPGWDMHGDRSYYSVRAGFYNSIVANNGWKEKLGIVRAESRTIRGLCVEHEGIVWQVNDFTVTSVVADTSNQREDGGEE